MLNPVVQYSGGDDSILYGTDGIRWFYSIVHVSSIPSGWSIEVIDNYGRVEYGMMSETSIPLICCGKAIDSLFDGDGISICYSLMSG